MLGFKLHIHSKECEQRYKKYWGVVMIDVPFTHRMLFLNVLKNGKIEFFVWNKKNELYMIKK